MGERARTAVLHGQRSLGARQPKRADQVDLCAAIFRDAPWRRPDLHVMHVIFLVISATLDGLSRR